MLAKLSEDLIGAGYSEARIGAAVGLSQPSVHRIRRGRQVKVNFHAVDALRALHEKTFAAAPAVTPARATA